VLGGDDLNFRFVSTKASGFKVEGEARDMVLINTQKGQKLLVGRNNASVQVFAIQK